MLRRTAALVALGVAVLALGGCRLDVDVEVALDRNGGGLLSFTLTADAELLARAEEAGASPLADLAATVRELDGWRVAERADDTGGMTVMLSTRFGGPEELAALVDEVAGALAAPEVTLLEPMSVELGADTVRLRGAAGLVPTEHVTELGLLPDDAVRLIAEQDAVGYTVRATLPGAILDANATEVSGRTAVWRIEPGERAELEVVGERPAPPVVPMVLGGLLGALAVGGALVLRRRSG